MLVAHRPVEHQLAKKDAWMDLLVSSEALDLSACEIGSGAGNPGFEGVLVNKPCPRLPVCFLLLFVAALFLILKVIEMQSAASQHQMRQFMHQGKPERVDPVITQG